MSSPAEPFPGRAGYFLEVGLSRMSRNCVQNVQRQVYFMSRMSRGGGGGSRHLGRGLMRSPRRLSGYAGLSGECIRTTVFGKKVAGMGGRMLLKSFAAAAA